VIRQTFLLFLEDKWSFPTKFYTTYVLSSLSKKGVEREQSFGIRSEKENQNT